MRNSHSIPVLLIATLAGCASLGGTRDPMCAPLRDFVQSIEPGTTRDVTFRTNWGSNFRDDPKPAIFAKRCEHANYGPAKPLCDYLMDHGAVEFSTINAQRAVGCLAPGTRFGGAVEWMEGTFQVGYGTPERGSTVTIAYGSDNDVGGNVLSIVARGY